MSKTRWIPAIAGAAVWLLALAPHAEGQTIKREPIQPISSISGADSFKAYCTVCHGVAGKGDGPAAKALKVPPPDLTQLAAKHEGKFPASAVKMTVIGEQPVAAHGSQEMPIWGPLFRSVDTAPIAELRVTNIVKYLESIQEKR
jgi:mono/diheme cytochrome c family protein